MHTPFPSSTSATTTSGYDREHKLDRANIGFKISSTESKKSKSHTDASPSFPIFVDSPHLGTNSFGKNPLSRGFRPRSQSIQNFRAESSNDDDSADLNSSSPQNEGPISKSPKLFINCNVRTNKKRSNSFSSFTGMKAQQDSNSIGKSKLSLLNISSSISVEASTPMAEDEHQHSFNQKESESSGSPNMADESDDDSVNGGVWINGAPSPRTLKNTRENMVLLSSTFPPQRRSFLFQNQTPGSPTSEMQMDHHIQKPFISSTTNDDDDVHMTDSSRQAYSTTSTITTEDDDNDQYEPRRDSKRVSWRSEGTLVSVHTYPSISGYYEHNPFYGYNDLEFGPDEHEWQPQTSTGP